ncbi:MAG: ATP-binding protein [Bacteroidales bacterium]|nr:ATP-binding protein [Bacteroidales bacterium]
MYQRNAVKELLRWKDSKGRKPLVLRGARQVGKTTIVNLFAENYAQYVYLNLERDKDREIFIKYGSIEEIVQYIFLQYNKSLDKIGDTLLFIDEIQIEPKAVAMLRYFYEDYPHLHVIAAGSMLETLFDRGINFPVGRVEFRVMHPVNFEEFLGAMGENQALELYNNIPLPAFAHTKLLQLFHTYTLIGGMPEVVSEYAENKDITSIPNIYESLIATYFDDVEKYAKNANQVQLVRHAIRSSFYEAGTRIRYQGFGASSYNSREISEVLRMLEKTMLIHLVFPTTQTSAPFMPDVKKSPKLQALDTGMVNYFSGLQKELFGTKDLNSHYQGKIAEHIVGQEMLSSNYNVLNALHFWVREKKQSDAEVDFLYKFDGQVIPVEVKSGTYGKLRSLHQFLELSEISTAVRFYAGPFQVEEHKLSTGKLFKLINIPYFLSGKLNEYLDSVQC